MDAVAQSRATEARKKSRNMTKFEKQLRGCEEGYTDLRSPLGRVLW
jgi:hypothetical protein